MSELPLYRFVHISDIHFGQEQAGEVVFHTDVREQLLADCELLTAKLGKASGVIITGDIAFSGKQVEYARAGEWLDRLTGIIGCERTSVLMIPGNHDVNFDEIGSGVQVWHDELRRYDLNVLDKNLAKITQHQGEGNLLFAKLGSYREFAEGYNSNFLELAQPLWRRDLKLAGLNKLSIVGMNSVQVSDSTDKTRGRGSMILGQNQYILPPEKCVEFIALIHHPLSWFRDSSRAEQYLKRARVLMFGHEHQMKTEKHTNADGVEWIELYSGAVTPPLEDGTAYGYKYNWLEFNIFQVSEKAYLRCVVHPRAWNFGQTKFDKDTSLNLNDCDAFELDVHCPHFELTKNDTSPTPLVRNTGEETTLKEEGVTMSREPTELKFDRLRLFFWRYLDWRSRLKVLAKLNALPESLEKPIPQTMERLALDMLKEQGKLFELWENVMEYVPEAAKESNPFTDQGEKKS